MTLNSGLMPILAALLVNVSICRGQESDSRNAGKEKGTVVTLDGLQARTPGEWVEEKTNRPFRHKQFRLPAVGADKEPGELIIFFFGEGQGGTVTENVKRWQRMFRPPEGKSIDDVTKQEKKKFGGVPATYLEIEGTYLYKARPFDPDAQATPKKDHRMVNVILETKNGPFFIRLVGHQNTIKHYKKGFDQWLEALK